MRKKEFSTIPLLLAFILSVSVILTACSAPTASNEAETTATEAAPTDTAEPVAELPGENDLVIAEKGKDTQFAFVYNSGSIVMPEVNGLLLTLTDFCGRDIVADTEGWQNETSDNKFEFLIGKNNRTELGEVFENLANNQCRIKVYCADGGESAKVAVAFSDYHVGRKAIEYIIENFMHGSYFAIPKDCDETLTFKTEKDIIIKSNISRLRDPFILLDDDGTYYMYGTGWMSIKNDNGGLGENWYSPKNCVTVPEDAVNNYWAPEVYKYNGSYYMFTTYLSGKTNHRGCSIFKSDAPQGPFVQITDGFVTPEDWDSIDGTFYVDEDGQPWMIFVHEWTSTEDNIGRMAAAKLSDDLTHFISEPIELFRADDPSWARGNITDGCFMYKTEDGNLLMLWSNTDDYGYCVGIARSDNGKVDGNWIQEDELLYSKKFFGNYDGGHGMILTDSDGRKYLVIHSPNASVDGRDEKPVMIPVVEKNGTLVIDD